MERLAEDELVEILEAVAENDLSRVPTGKDRASRALARFIERLKAETSSRLDHAVETTIRANEISVICASSIASSEGIENAAQSVAATSEELSASVVTIEAEIVQCRERAEKMHEVATKTDEGMAAAVGAMQQAAGSMQSAAKKSSDLTEAANRINSVVGTIDSIARQTNLLALNASIEAARAGDAGKGFGVVAGEVRTLSEKIRESTESIRHMVEGFQQAVGGILSAINEADTNAGTGRKHIEDFGDVLKTLLQGIGDLGESVSSIATSVSEQSHASTQLATAATETSRLADDNLCDIRHVFDTIETLVDISGTELAEIAKADVPNKIARLAMADHVIWKKQLVDMFSGRRKLAASQLPNHHNCRMGQWYHGPDARHLRGTPLFDAMETPHAAVHDLGLRAVQEYNAGRHKEALSCIQEMEHVSEELLDLLGKFVREEDHSAAAAA